MSEQGNSVDKLERQEKLKKYLIVGLFIILFCVVVFFILKPYIIKETDGQESGINTEVPTATAESMPKDKREAYENNRNVTIEDKEAIKQEQMEDLYAFFNGQEASQVQDANAENIDEVTPAEQAKMLNEAQQAYLEATRLQNQYAMNSGYGGYSSVSGSSYNEGEIISLEEELYAEQDKVEKLKKELSMYKDAEAQEERQIRLLEKSYQLANQYNKPPEPVKVEEPKPKEGDRNLETVSVEQRKRNIVSFLPQTEKDTALLVRMIDFPEQANMSFNTAVGQKQMGFLRNTVRAVVSETQTVKGGDNVALQLLEDMRLANGLLVPKNTKIIAKANVSGNRMNLMVQSVEVGGVLAGLNLSAYDLSGQEGVYIPDAPLSDAVREFSSGVINTISSGSQYSLNTDPKGQLVSDLVRGAVTGAGNILQDKVQEYKVTLKSGYRLLLYDRNNKDDLNN